MIDGNTEVIAHIGYPTHAFKAPMIFNPYFDLVGLNAKVIPLGCQAADYPQFLRTVMKASNVKGALVTMPHKVVTVELLDEVSPTVLVAGACNAVRKLDDGRLIGGQFDGEGFVRGVRRKGLNLQGAKALVIGCGGVGSPIAASLAAAGVRFLAVCDVVADSAHALASRLQVNYPDLTVSVVHNDPAGYDLVVNATPLGMRDGDPLPLDVSRLSPDTFVGEVVMRSETTPLLKAALAKGCAVQVGADMLFEMIPAYLEFFGYPTASPEQLRAVATLRYAA